MAMHTSTTAMRRGATGHRSQIEAEIERRLAEAETLIALLDAFDGDCDLEDDDPAGDLLEIYGEQDGVDLPRPVYAVDQSFPLNQFARLVAAVQMEAA